MKENSGVLIAFAVLVLGYIIYVVKTIFFSGPEKGFPESHYKKIEEHKEKRRSKNGKIQS